VSLTVLIAGGGTGGHLYPGVAVARELRRRLPDAAVAFVGTAAGLEVTVVPRERFELDVIRSAGLKGKSVWVLLRGLALIPVSAFDAWRVLSRRRPAAVVGVGGYSSGPVVLMAALRGIPTLVLEQNVVPGLTNRLLARWIGSAAVTYEETLPYFRGKGIVTGNPVRPEFVGARPEAAAGVRVLVVGGSQGAHALNLAMLDAAPRLVGRHPGLEIVHQTGARDLASVRAGYRRAGVRARAEAYLDPLADEMAAASLVVCRAGATTLAELAAMGRPAVLVPFPTAADDHQRRNALTLAAAGAAEVIEEHELTGLHLADRLASLLDDAAGRRAMAGAMSRQARPDAAERIVEHLLREVGVHA
jgi:UDP-N-acetylglucosamine--N-acetylmuramyl-(pentapeptide) pyrophosphoryl-undecaprenol N-acetylglucosamine transferase